jgi:hypothetical protein
MRKGVLRRIRIDKFGKGKVARLESESFGDGQDVWVGLVDQDIGYHFPTDINQVSMQMEVVLLVLVMLVVVVVVAPCLGSPPSCCGWYLWMRVWGLCWLPRHGSPASQQMFRK